MTDLILCRKCDIVKPVSAFYLSSIRASKNTGECKDCVCSRVKAANNKPHRREYLSSDEFKKVNSGKISRYMQRYPGRCKARDITKKAIDRGDLIRPVECSVCSNEGVIEAHHDDYNHPLDVRWLCKTCHGEWHRHNKPVYINQ